VAELIADAFSQELDDRGAAALREMRLMSRLGGLLGVLNLTTGEFEDFFGGFVWVEQGKVVGNVTVQRADKYGSRWQIANVAVAPPYRGRGLSRRLMERALGHIREQGGAWAVLQVYAENHIARSLYERMGFEVVGGVAEMEARRPADVPPPPRIPDFYSVPAGQWQPLYELAASQLAAQAQWWRPVRRSEFQRSLEQQASEWVWKVLGRRQVLRRCIQRGQRFDAALVLTVQRWKAPHKFQMWVRPDQYGRDEHALVHWAMHTLRPYPPWPVTASLPSDHDAGIEALRRFGFAPVRTLLTMRLELGRA
jgi:ribosomal protein S18 acetylase RimI-like enzyme